MRASGLPGASLAAGLAAFADEVTQGADALWRGSLATVGAVQPSLRSVGFDARFGLRPLPRPRLGGTAPLALLGLDAPAGPAHEARLAIRLAATPEPFVPGVGPPRVSVPRWFVGGRAVEPDLLPEPDDGAALPLLLRVPPGHGLPEGALLGFRLPPHGARGGWLDPNPDAPWRAARCRLARARGRAPEEWRSGGTPWPGDVLATLLSVLADPSTVALDPAIAPEGVFGGAARDAVAAGAALAARLAERQPTPLAAALGAAGQALVGFELRVDALIGADGQPAGPLGLDVSDPGAVTARIVVRLEEGGASLLYAAPPDLALGLEERSAAALALARAAASLGGSPRRVALLRAAPGGSLRTLLRSGGGHGAGGQRLPMEVLAQLDDGAGPPALLHLGLDLHREPDGGWAAGLSGDTEPRWLDLPDPAGHVAPDDPLAAILLRSAALAGTWWRAVTGLDA